MYTENHSLGEWFQKAYGDEGERKTPFAIIEVRSANCTKDSKGRTVRMGLNDIHSLSHTKWNCKYHIVLPIVISITQGFTSIPKAKS